MTARHCFAEEQHPPHVWRTFGVGNFGLWDCDGSPVLVLRQEVEGTWTRPAKAHEPCICMAATNDLHPIEPCPVHGRSVR